MKGPSPASTETNLADLDVEVVDNVIIGRDGVLYLSSDRHFTVDLMLGRRSVSPKSFQAFKNNIEQRRAKVESSGARYIHLVAPDKHVVLPEQFPVQGVVSLADQYRAQTGVDFLHPVAELRTTPESYGRTDTHWSARGRILIAGLIATQFGRPPSEVVEGLDALHGALRPEGEVAGDLGVKLTPPRTHASETLELPWTAHIFSNGVKSGNDGRLIAMVSRSPLAQGRLLVFGDSFIAQAQTSLTAFFREIVFCRTPYFHDEIFRGFRPDYVVSENAERYLSGVAQDAEAPLFLLVAAAKGRQSTYKPGHGAAVSAMLATNTRAHDRFMDGLDLADGIGARPT